MTMHVVSDSEGILLAHEGTRRYPELADISRASDLWVAIMVPWDQRNNNIFNADGINRSHSRFWNRQNSYFTHRSFCENGVTDHLSALVPPPHVYDWPRADTTELSSTSVR